MLENENEKIDDINRSRLSSISTYQGDSTTNGNGTSKDKLYPTGFTSIAEHDEREQARNSETQQPPFLSEDNRHPTSYILHEEDLAPSIPPFVGTPVPLTFNNNNNGGEPRRSSMGPPQSRVALPPPVMDYSRQQSYPAQAQTTLTNYRNEFAPPMAAFGSAGGTGVPTYTPSGNTPFYDARESPYEQQGEQQRGYFGRAQ